MRAPDTGRGQVQKWFYVRLVDTAATIDFSRVDERKGTREFSAYGWMSFAELLAAGEQWTSARGDDSPRRQCGGPASRQLSLSRGVRRRPRSQRGIGTGSRMDSRGLWSAARVSRLGRSCGSKCTCHAGLGGVGAFAGGGLFLPSLMVRPLVRMPRAEYLAANLAPQPPISAPRQPHTMQGAALPSSGEAVASGLAAAVCRAKQQRARLGASTATSAWGYRCFPLAPRSPRLEASAAMPKNKRTNMTMKATQPAIGL
jgi:hypothetical protein